MSCTKFLHVALRADLHELHVERTWSTHCGVSGGVNSDVSGGVKYAMSGNDLIVSGDFEIDTASK